ncbi:MAG: hypothetical protein LUD74_05070, partial [Tannerellaceae bacterium]|nr:hypothetical protein [Tannerellaceae bacterium]
VYTGSEVIGKGVLSNNIQVDNYTEASIPIVYTEGNKKATSIEILFASSDTTTDFNIVSGGSVSIEVANSNTSGIVSSAGTSTTYNGVNYGSTLKIDNVTLNYTGE